MRGRRTRQNQKIKEQEEKEVLERDDINVAGESRKNEGELTPEEQLQ